MKNHYLTNILIPFFSLLISFSFAQDPGELDLSFDPGDGADGIVFAVALQTDGKILMGGGFSDYDGTARNGIARLNEDGSLDTSFDPGSGIDGVVYTIVVQPDGKIMIGGGFSMFNGISRNRIARLNTDGSLDNTFDPGLGASGSIHRIAIQQDGKMIIGGLLTTYNGDPANHIARIHTDGSLDNSFMPGTGATSNVLDIVFQPDGKILICGLFNEYDGTVRGGIARLNSDGSLDSTLDPGTGAVGNVYELALQADGKVLLVGNFSTFNGDPVGHIVRLNSDGSVDGTFVSGTAADDELKSIALQPDGKILIGGKFIYYDGTPYGRIGRLNADGSPDASFDTGLGVFGNIVYEIAVQPDHKIMIGGSFISYDGTPRKGIARLAGGSNTAISEHHLETFNISPNPSSSIVNLSFSAKAEYILIHDQLGAQVLHKPYTEKLDLSLLDTGVYLLSLIDSHGKPLITERLVKK